MTDLSYQKRLSPTFDNEGQLRGKAIRLCSRSTRRFRRNTSAKSVRNSPIGETRLIWTSFAIFFCSSLTTFFVSICVCVPHTHTHFLSILVSFLFSLSISIARSPKKKNNKNKAKQINIHGTTQQHIMQLPPTPAPPTPPISVLASKTLCAQFALEVFAEGAPVACFSFRFFTFSFSFPVRCHHHIF